MSQLLLSINPEHVENILLGTKQVEFRKTRCRRNVNSIVFYATAPQKMVVAEAEIQEIIEDEIDEVWRQTSDLAGISYSFFRSYYQGRTRAVAYRLRNVKIYERPKSLLDFGVSCAPQSYVYIDEAG